MTRTELLERLATIQRYTRKVTHDLLGELISDIKEDGVLDVQAPIAVIKDMGLPQLSRITLRNVGQNGDDTWVPAAPTEPDASKFYIKGAKFAISVKDHGSSYWVSTVIDESAEAAKKSWCNTHRDVNPETVTAKEII